MFNILHKIKNLFRKKRKIVISYDFPAPAEFVVKKPQLKKATTRKKKEMATKPGLYANIHKKQARIAAGSKEKMRPVGSKGAPSKQDFINSAKTAKKK